MFRFRTNPEFRAPLTAGGSSTFGYLLAAGVGLVVALFVLMAFSASRGGADELTCPDPLPPDLPSLYCLPPNPLDTETIALYPEGIAADNESGDFYVSSVADGSIYRGNVSSSNAVLFLPGGEDGRTSATGLKLDAGRLFVAGAFYDFTLGLTGKVFIYDTSSKDLIRRFEISSSDLPQPQLPGFLNDVAVTNSGDAFITDSFQPVIWRVPAEAVKNSSEPGELEPWLNLTGTLIEYTEGFNLNGIVATPNGRYLLTVQSNTGNLYRIDTQTQQVSLVEGLGDEALLNGDGLVLKGHTLYVIRNQGIITEVSLGKKFESGQVEGDTSVPIPEDFPTTAALVGGRLLVVNSQFAEGGPGRVYVPPEDPEPEIPFTVSAIPAP
jgi:sugar lactone lactonase YvrE